MEEIASTRLNQKGRRLLLAALLSVGATLLATSVAGPAESQSADDLADASIQAVPVAPPVGVRPAGEGLEPLSAPEGDFSAASTTERCGDGKGCMWHYAGFEGRKEFAYDYMADDGWRSYPGFTFASVKNRFGSRKLVVADYLAVTACLDPGENRFILDYQSDRFNVGRVGSRC